MRYSSTTSLSNRGIFRYRTFGLKVEWINLFIRDGFHAFSSSGLGPKQVISLYEYMRDAEYLENKKNYSPYAEVMTKISHNTISFYSILWVHLCHNSNLFLFWAQKLPGRYPRHVCIDALSELHGRYNKGIDGAYNSLVSSLQYTPFGKMLQMGDIVKRGNARMIQKSGLFPFPARVCLYSLYRCCIKHNQFEHALKEIENDIFSPQRILCQTTEYIRKAILTLPLPDFYTVRMEGERVVFHLNQERTIEDYLRLFNA